AHRTNSAAADGRRVDHRWSLRRDEGASRRFYPDRGARHQRGAGDRGADPGCALWRRRGPADPAAAARQRRQRHSVRRVQMKYLIELRPVRTDMRWGTRMSDGAASIRSEVEAVYRAESRRVLATLIRLLGGFERAEEAVHDAFAAASE